MKSRERHMHSLFLRQGNYSAAKDGRHFVINEKDDYDIAASVEKFAKAVQEISIKSKNFSPRDMADLTAALRVSLRHDELEKLVQMLDVCIGKNSFDGRDALDTADIHP